MCQLAETPIGKPSHGKPDREAVLREKTELFENTGRQDDARRAPFAASVLCAKTAGRHHSKDVDAEEERARVVLPADVGAVPVPVEFENDSTEV